LKQASASDAVSIPFWCDSNNVPEAGLTYIWMFQFHSGAIQTLVMDANRNLLNMFQFHSGAIQTGILYEAPQDQDAFQFHSGAIQTMDSMSTPGTVVSFNSILVRFKQRHGLL